MFLRKTVVVCLFNMEHPSQPVLSPLLLFEIEIADGHVLTQYCIFLSFSSTPLAQLEGKLLQGVTYTEIQVTGSFSQNVSRLYQK